ncbi:hypothetical protein HK103_003141 [Boothiomyces macroporosus]|uniref:F-box domain-containing protein n=1 Tax=Boothiomyces macroporosus TaxID=261099 RepID=A0AAD5UJ74_9FUNG|nr:hypothetical protein HK103_003141 [Boothiomyces macroporosus]
MNLTALPKDIHYMLAQYMNEYNMVNLSLSCKYFNKLCSPFRKLVGKGEWPVACCNSNNYQILKNIQKHGFQFKNVTIIFPFNSEFLANPPAASVTLDITKYNYDKNAPIDLQQVLDCKFITQIVVNSLGLKDDQFYEAITADIIPGIIKNLSLWKKLLVLEIETEYVDFNLLAENLPQSSVVELKIHRGRDFQGIFPIIEKTKLKSLLLHDSGLNDQDLVAVAGYLGKWKIEKLSFRYNCSITQIGISAITNAIPVSNLQYLDLSYNEFGIKLPIEMAKKIFETTKISKLKAFNFEPYPRNLEMDRLIAEYLPYFVRRHLWFEYEDDILYSLLSRNLKSARACSISLKIPVVLAVLPEILQAISKSKLKMVDFREPENIVTSLDGDLEFSNVFAPYINSLNIHHFEINGVRRTRMVLQHLTKKSRLLEIKIIPTCLTIDLNELEMIAEYLKNSNVTAIRISHGIRWSDDALVKIAEIFNGTTVTVMSINAQGVTKEGIARLVEKLKTVQLSAPIYLNLKLRRPGEISFISVSEPVKSMIRLAIE